MKLRYLFSLSLLAPVLSPAARAVKGALPRTISGTSGITLPLAYVDVEASETAGNFLGRRSDDIFGLFDIAVTPIIASYHLSKTDRISSGLTVWAPTGEYEEGQLANLSTNNWTFIPTIAYTKILPVSNIELTRQWSLQLYTENEATDYQNGIVSDLEFAAIKRFQNGFGIGLVGSWMDQMTDDDGPTADALNGLLDQAGRGRLQHERPLDPRVRQRTVARGRRGLVEPQPEILNPRTPSSP